VSYIAELAFWGLIRININIVSQENKQGMTNPIRILFAVPIYRESEQEYYSSLDAEDKSRLKEQAQRMKRFLGGSVSSPDVENRIGDLTPANTNRKAWRYNRIVGWIEFYSDRRTIKADLWLAKGKTVRQDFKAVTLEYKGKIGDVVLAHRASNPEIREAVHNFLAGFERGAYSWVFAKRFYVDKAFLLRQIDFLDIRSLIDKVEEDRDHG